jgi:hypothetical protein
MEKKLITQKSVKSNEIILFKPKTISTSRPIYHSAALLITNHILKLLACVETPYYCCVIF